MPTPIIPSADYYDDQSLHGNYQYITLEDIINNYAMSRVMDDNTSLVPRHQILFQARRGMRELYYDVVKEVRAIELELSPRLNIPLPPDFVNMVRISWVDDQGLLHPMAEDRSLSIAQEYLQDNDYFILFDEEGCPLQASNGFNEPSQSPLSQSALESYSNKGYTSYNFCSSFQPNKSASRTFSNGRYKIDKTSGLIQFGSDAVDKRVVLEYISDGLYTGCEGRPEAELRIHKFAESALMDYIYYSLIRNRGSIPANEKIRARKEYYNSRRIAKRRLSTMRYDELMQYFKHSSKWIK